MRLDWQSCIRSSFRGEVMEIETRDCEIEDYALRIDVLDAVNKLKQRYPNFIPAIDEAFCDLIP